jgi:hypothetical protein
MDLKRKLENNKKVINHKKLNKNGNSSERDNFNDDGELDEVIIDAVTIDCFP